MGLSSLLYGQNIVFVHMSLQTNGLGGDYSVETALLLVGFSPFPSGLAKKA